jgi:hypothetical protein
MNPFKSHCISLGLACAFFFAGLAFPNQGAPGAGLGITRLVIPQHAAAGDGAGQAPTMWPSTAKVRSAKTGKSSTVSSIPTPVSR